MFTNGLYDDLNNTIQLRNLYENQSEREVIDYSLRARIINLFLADGRSSGVIDRVHSMCTVIKLVLSQGCHRLAVGSDKTGSDTPPSIMSFTFSLKLRRVSHGRRSGPASWQLQRVEGDRHVLSRQPSPCSPVSVPRLKLSDTLAAAHTLAA